MPCTRPLQPPRRPLRRQPRRHRWQQPPRDASNQETEIYQGEEDRLEDDRRTITTTRSITTTITVVRVATAGTTTTTTIENTGETGIVTSEIEIVTFETETRQGLGTTEIVRRVLGIVTQVGTTGGILPGREILSTKTRDSGPEILIKDRGPRPGKSTTRNWKTGEPSSGSGTMTIVATLTKGDCINQRQKFLKKVESL